MVGGGALGQLRGEVVAKLGDITYWYTNKTNEGETIKIFKRVYFYLIRRLKGDVARHDKEVEEASREMMRKAMELRAGGRDSGYNGSASEREKRHERRV